jgi:Fe-S-cluster formation regulator IscX/YfhJ
VETKTEWIARNLVNNTFVGPCETRQEIKWALARRLVSELSDLGPDVDWKALGDRATVLHELASDGPAFEHDNVFRSSSALVCWELIESDLPVG